ncbi:hypothetical protein E2C01_097717 [Portunus trituberculatus]|uniref:Uncharacterized protein n=1 Tax=Portunus trituberculatus TaxID=210409 RepID=A0A5B7K6E9_PORTR|nr:hypothetical protein [Portunus trituberculatus]
MSHVCFFHEGSWVVLVVLVRSYTRLGKRWMVAAAVVVVAVVVVVVGLAVVMVAIKESKQKAEKRCV